MANEIKAIDDKRFQIILKQPFRTMLSSLGSRNIFVQPERIARTPVAEQIKEVIGRDKYVPRSEAPDFWSGGHIGTFDRVEWTAQPDSSTAAAALQRGEVDWLQQPRLDLLPMLGKTAGIKIDAVDPFGNLAILRFNHLLPPFNNAEMRRALLPGIDQMGVVQAVVGDQEQYGSRAIGVPEPAR
jgi:peptide/nickel transport system substrate-binding protein